MRSPEEENVFPLKFSRVHEEVLHAETNKHGGHIFRCFVVFVYVFYMEQSPYRVYRSSLLNVVNFWLRMYKVKHGTCKNFRLCSS